MSGQVEELTDERRRELFAALVAARDEGLSVSESRATIARRFGVDPETVAEVEEEGWTGTGRPSGG